MRMLNLLQIWVIERCMELISFTALGNFDCSPSSAACLNDLLGFHYNLADFETLDCSSKQSETGTGEIQYYGPQCLDRTIIWLQDWGCSILLFINFSHKREDILFPFTTEIFPRRMYSALSCVKTKRKRKFSLMFAIYFLIPLQGGHILDEMKFPVFSLSFPCVT